MTGPVSGRLDAWFDGLWSNDDFRRLWLALTSASCVLLGLLLKRISPIAALRSLPHHSA